MILKPEEKDTVKKWAIEKFGEESVKRLDLLFFEFHDIQATCKDNDPDEKTEKYGEAK